MTLVEQIQNEFNRLLKEGVTQKSIADRLGVTPAHANKILCGKRALSGVSIQCIQNAFPGALLTTISGNGLLSNGTINGNITQTSKDSIEQFKGRILSLLLGLDIPEDCLVKVMKLVNEAE